VIYHIVGEAEFRAACDGAVYRPASLAVDGFVHCSLEPSVIPVANDYYRDAEGPLLLLQIDPWGLTAETRYEQAAPPPGADITHLDSSPVFPHVYGPIDLGAIDGVGVLMKTADGYAWPEEFFPIDVALSPNG
jgi:uncharacterized protein (DUF952 family)